MPRTVPAAAVADEARAILVLAAPLVAGQLAAFGMNVVDTLMSGWLSPATLAAVALGSTAWMGLALFVVGTLLALPPFVSQLVGAGRRREAGPVTWQAFWLAQAMALGLIVAVRGVRPVAHWIGVEPALVPDVMDYLVAVAWGAPAFCGYLCLRFFSEGWGYTRPVMYFGFLGVALNVPANWVLMYGAFGLPGYGPAGCGYATALVFWLQFVALAIYVARRPRYRDAQLFRRVTPPDRAVMAALLAVGLPIGTAIFMEGSLFTGITLLIGSLGTETVAAHQVAINFSSILFMVPLGVAMAITVRVGNAVGRGDPAGARRAGLTGVAMIAIVQCAWAALMLFAPGAIARIYTDDPAVGAKAVVLMTIAAGFQLPDGIQVGMAGALRGMKDTFKPMLLTVVAYWCLGLPTGWWMGFRAGYGAPGLWLGLIAGLGAAALLLSWRFVRVSRHVPAPGPVETENLVEALDPRGQP